MSSALKTTLKHLCREERGAATVDWVSLTAGLMVMGLAIVWFVMDEGVDVLAGKIVGGLTSTEVMPIPEMPTFGDGE